MINRRIMNQVLVGSAWAVALLVAGSTALGHPECPGEGDCCDPAGNGTPGCDDVECCNLVCDTLDAFCCDSFWDALCASTALAFCANCALPGCPLDCPPGALDEGEPCLVDEDTDVTNAGCNEDPAAFTDASCGDTFCGQISTYTVDGGDNRDTDWYLVNHPGGTISATLISQFPGLCFIVDGVGPGGVPCEATMVGDIGCSSDCGSISVASASLPAGTVVVFVSSGDCAGGGLFSGIPCGDANDYVLEITCSGPCETDEDCTDGDPCNGQEWCDAGGLCQPAPPEPDCNENGVLDSCDIDDGTSPDCNGNGIPDDCDIADDTSTDVNGNGVPDECECLGDIDNNGTRDVNDFLLLLEFWGPCPE